MGTHRKLGRRLDALSRGGSGKGRKRPGLEDVVCARRLVRRNAVRAGAKSAADAAPPGPTALGTAVPGVEIEAPGGGMAWLVRGSAPVPAGGPYSGLDGVLFFDIEACGLSAAPLFLIGVMTEENGVLETRQYLARDYSEEGAAIRHFAKETETATHLVSFNGKSYDLPYIRNRAVQSDPRLAGPLNDLDLPHTDLLHTSRRRWGLMLSNCRLGTLERKILGVHRTDDIPGAEIPEAYHEFVRTGDARIMARIIEHNRIDLVSMASLLALAYPNSVTIGDAHSSALPVRPHPIRQA